MPQVVNLRAYMALGKSDLYLKLQILKVTSGAITFCCVAVFTHNIYLVAAAVLIHTVFCVLAIDMPPAKRIYGLSMIKQLKIIFPTTIMSCLAAAIANLIQVLQLDYFLQIVIQVLVFIIVYTALAKLTNCTGLQTCLDALKQLIGR